MLYLPFPMLMIGSGSSHSGYDSLAFQSSATATVSGTSTTFSSQAIGSATSATRYIFVAYMDNSGVAPSDLTLGGSSMTFLQAFSSGTGVINGSVWSLLTPTGTTATLVYSTLTSRASKQAAICVWSVNMSDPGAEGSHDVNSTSSATNTTVNIGANGFALYASAVTGDLTDRTFAATGSNVVDADLFLNPFNASFGHFETVASATAKPMGGTFTSTSGTEVTSYAQSWNGLGT